MATQNKLRNISRYQILTLLIVMICGVCHISFGADNKELGLDFLNDPRLKGKIELIRDGERQRLQISLSELLYLTLNRSLDLKLRELVEEATEAQLITAQERNIHVLTTSIRQAKNASQYSTNFTGEDLAFGSFGPKSPYLSTTETDSTTVYANWSKKTDSGITLSSTLLRTVSQSKRHKIAEQGEELIVGDPLDDPLEMASLNAKVSIPLFQDWGEVNELTVRRAEVAVEQSKLTTTSQLLNLLESVSRTYWNLVRITENIRILEEAVKLSEQLLKETQARVEVGLLQQTDLKEVNTQLAANLQELLSTRIKEQEIEDQLRTFINLKTGQIGFLPSDSPQIHEEKYEHSSLLQKIFQGNSELLGLENSLRANRYDLVEALNRDKTNLDVEVEYKLKGYGVSVSEAFQGFGKSQFHDYEIGLNWVVPLFDKATPQSILKRKIETNQLELRIRNKKLQLSVKLQTILRNLSFALEEQKTAVMSLNLAKDLLEKEVEKLKIGKSTSYNVSLAQQRYTRAKFNEIVVRVRNEQNFISLLTLTGEIFSYFKLSEHL